ncbi:hypothetical protein KFU94_03080 [Chloroflexi bacterium TSY]|nr:hypothetical protein [Chloroflexi bacterium TSY]
MHHSTYFTILLLPLALLVGACQPLPIELALPTATVQLATDQTPTDKAQATATEAPSTEAPELPLSDTLSESTIAFMSFQIGHEDLDIVVADQNASNGINITKDSRANDLLPAWSPDGEKIAFVSDRDGNSEIYTMNPDGSEIVRLTSDPASDWTPTWLPDGRIGFISDRDDFYYDIYVMNSDGSNVIRLTATLSEEMAPVWSPNGSKIAFLSDRDGNSEIYVMNADGTDAQNLTSHAASDYEPEWSPDGTQLLFTSDRNGQADIFVMNADGSNVTPVAQSPADDLAGSWSPDGKQIIFTSTRNGGHTLYRITIGENRARRLEGFLGVGDSQPSWLHKRELLPISPIPQQSASIEPVTDFDLVGKVFVSKVLGISVHHPLGWFAADNLEMGTILIADDFETFRKDDQSALAKSFGILFVPVEYGEPRQIINEVAQRIPVISGSALETETVYKEEHSILIAEYLVTSTIDDSPVHYFIAAISNSEISAMAFAMVMPERVDELRPTFDKIIQTVRLTQPDAP